MNLKGKLQQKLEVEKGTTKAGKEWSKQTIIINNGDQYNPLTAISFFGNDKVKMLEKFNIGQDIEVGINLSSKEFNGNWYNQIDGWKINAVGQEPTESNSNDDGLPF